MRFLIVQYSI